MGAPVLASRARRAVLAALVAGLAVGCDPTPTGPGTLQFGPLHIRPVLESAVDPSQLGLDSIQVTIRRADDGSSVADTALGFDADADEVLAWVLGLEDLPTMLIVDVTIRAGSTPMFGGSLDVEIAEGVPVGEDETRDVVLGFIGPGAGVTALVVTPGDALLTFGETVQYAVSATDAAGNPVANPVIVWTSSDPDLAPIGTDAELVAPEARGAVEVTAETPTGITGSAAARFQPPATGLVVVAGDGATAAVTESVALEVRVVGDDGEGVEGVTVTFAAPPGGSVGAAEVVSEADGIAATMAVLGTTADTHVFTASVDAVAPVTLSVTAEPGPPAALAFATQPAPAEAGDLLAPVTVHVLDAFGNLTTAASTVSLGLGTNPNQATLLGTTVADAGAGVATFDDLAVDRPGSGFTLIATATDLADAESQPFDITRVPVSVTVTPGNALLVALDQQVPLDAVAFDAAEDPIAGQAFTWTTGDAGVAVVDADGVVTAIANGTTTITAAAGDASDVATIVVEQESAIVTVTGGGTLTALDAQLQLAALVADANAHPLPDQTVTWSSMDPEIATPDGAGLVTAVTNGTATIEARAGDAVGAATVTVRQHVATITVAPDPTTLTALQATGQLTATGRDANGHVVTDAAFIWSSDAESLVDVDQTGLATALANGTATITASADDGTGTAAVTVQQVPTSLEVSPGGATLTALADVVALTATARDANGFVVPDVEPSWTALDAGVASVDSEGLVTAVANGVAAVEAALGTLADTAGVTVAQVIATIVVTPGTVSFDALAGTEQLGTDAFDANGFAVPDAPEPAWSSDDDAVAAIGETGAVTAEGNGQTTVRARIGDAEGTATVAVQQVPASIEVTPEPETLTAIAAQTTLAATVRDANGFAIPDATPVWASLAMGVATVDQQGTVTAAANGVAPIAASIGLLADTGTVTVDQEVATVVVAPDPVVLTALEDQRQLSAQALDANGFAVPDAGGAVWSSDNGAVASVDAAGLVEAVTNGATAARAEIDGVQGTAAVTVRQRVATLNLALGCVEAAPPPANATAPPVLFATGGCDTLRAFDDQAAIDAEAFDANGHPVAAPAITWTSLAPGIVTVDANGVVTAAGNGTATVRATADDATAEIEVPVRQTVFSLVIQPDAVTLGAGEQAALVAIGRDANGFVITGLAVQWSSYDPEIASVGPAGLVTAQNAGTALIEAFADGVAANAVITVE